jgi:hypothetical protein
LNDLLGAACAKAALQARQVKMSGHAQPSWNERFTRALLVKTDACFFWAKQAPGQLAELRQRHWWGVVGHRSRFAAGSPRLRLQAFKAQKPSQLCSAPNTRIKPTREAGSA